MSFNTWIVLVNYNGLEDTRKCLQSLVGTRASVVVVDNASKVDPESMVRGEFPWAHYVQSGENGGWAGGNNVGMKHALKAGADLLILLNNDTTVPPQFVDRIEEAARNHPEFGMFGPIIRFMEEPCDIQTMGVVFNRHDRPGFFQPVKVDPDPGTSPKLVEIDIVNGCCLVARREVVEKIGLVDEQFFLIHEESDWCLRCQEAGYKLGVMTDALVWHKGSSSFKREGKGFQRYYDARNLIRLLHKHPRRGSSRGYLASRIAYFKYCWHRYCHERENGFRESAEAILTGVYDGLFGRYGVRNDRWRPGLGLLSFGVNLLWKIKGK